MIEAQIIQGRKIGEIQLEQIRSLINRNSGWSRRRLSVELCKIWHWQNLNGQLKDMAARTLLNKLADRKWIVLPLRQRRGGRRSFQIQKILQGELFPSKVITDSLESLRPLDFHLVKVQQPEAEIFRNYLVGYHYLSYSGPVGENLQYLVRDCYRRELACVLFGAAAWKVQARDEWIGWNSQQRTRRLGCIANNHRFLILPWVKVPHLASHILGVLMRRLSCDWYAKYAQPIYLVETFVQRDRFKGTCYRAANWIWAGETKGRSRQDRYTTLKVSVKDIYLFPLVKGFRFKLCEDSI